MSRIAKKPVAIAKGVDLHAMAAEIFGKATGLSGAGINFAYKVHLVYNLLLTPSGKTYNTVSETVEPLVNSFEGTTVPIPIAGKRPSAHLVVPSSAPQISALEDILYGTLTTTGRLPLPAEVYTIMGA